MPPKTVTLSSKLSEVVSRYPNQFTHNGKVLFCKICDNLLKYDVHHGNYSIKMHLKTDKHKNNLKIKEKSKSANQVMIENAFESANKSKFKFDKFLSDLIEIMVKCDIPLNKVNSSIFKEFMHKYTGHNIPERKAFDKYIGPLYDNTIGKIKEEIKDKNIYLIVDETSDKNHRNVLNVMVRVLDGNPKKSMLIKNLLLLQIIQQLCKVQGMPVCCYGLRVFNTINFD